MQIISDLGGISHVQFQGIRRMLTQRIAQMKIREGEALADVGASVVVADAVFVIDEIIFAQPAKRVK